MITLKLNNVPTLFIKAFTTQDVQAILEFVREAASFYSGDSNRILFIDTPITKATVEAVERLKAEGFRVCFRDHHGIDGMPSNDRENQVAISSTRLQELLADDCQITVRRLHPACSTLVFVGEFQDAIAIIADPDPDGLTGAMKASGIAYDGLDDDAALLDGEPQYQVTGTPISQLLAKGMAVIPSYDPAKPKEREIAQQKLFADWVGAVNENEAARKRLEERVSLYDQAVLVAQELATFSVNIIPGVVLIDAAHKPLFDPGTLAAIIENDEQCRIMVVRKSLGPIAALHGIQYSLSVAKSYQNTINLHHLIPSDTRSGPNGGVISNVSFLLHVSEDIWLRQVLPALKNMNLGQP